MFKEYGPYDDDGIPEKTEFFCDICGDEIPESIWDEMFNGPLNEIRYSSFNFGSCSAVEEFLGFKHVCKKCTPRVITFLIPMSDIYLLRRFVNKLQSKINERKRNDRKNDNRQIA